MKRQWALALGVSASATLTCGAHATFIESTFSGHYDSNGSFIGEPTALSMTTENYSAGFVIDAILPDADPFKVFVRRNYFVFDLSSLTEPVTEPKLVLQLGGYISPIPSHTFLVAFSSFSAAELDDPFGLVDPVSGQAEVFAKMGDPGAPGQDFAGEVDLVKADLDLLGPAATDFEVMIPLDEALFNDAIGGELVLTGRMFSDDGPTDIGLPGPDDDERILFGFTNPNEELVDSPLGATIRPRIEYVPEPGSLALITLGGTLLARRRR